MARCRNPLGPKSFIIAFSLLLAVAAYTQVQSRVSGAVRDVSNRPLSDVKVSVISSQNRVVQSTSTDKDGQYVFTSIAPGSYRLHASSKAGEGESSPFSLQSGESRIITLTVPSAVTTEASIPDFFDHPTFTVAGVTDTTNLGGHGSDTITRTKESLAKEVTGLRETNSSGPSNSAAESAACENAERNPTDFGANHAAGTMLLANGKPSAAITYLQRAHDLRPGDLQNSDALARALTEAGSYTDARNLIGAQIAKQDRAELHNLLGTVEERSGNSVEAEHQYQLAAKLDPSEQNLFDWGAELLLHHAAEPATEVFSEGAHRFPASSRMVTALGVAWYIRGSYARAAEILGRASDLDPKQPTPYIFLGHILAVETSSDEISKRLQRFLDEFPQDAQANYLVALSISKQALLSHDTAALERAQKLFARATELEPGFSAAYLQRGIVCTELQDIPSAISSLKHAVAVNPSLADAHYRLAQLYRRSGNETDATREFALYRESTASAQAQQQRERHDIQQFVIQSHKPQ